MEATQTNEAGTLNTQPNYSEDDNKHTLIFVKSHTLGEDSKGRTKLDLKFSPEETKQVIEELAKIKDRAKIQIHIGETSAFLFVKEVMTMEEVRAARTAAGKSNFRPNGGGFKPAVGSQAVKDKISKMTK